MGWKEVCYDWVVEHQYEDEDGNWWVIDDDQDTIAGPYPDQYANDYQDKLWDLASVYALERLIP